MPNLQAAPVLDEMEIANGLRNLIMDLILDLVPPGKPKLTLVLRRKGLTTDAIAKKMRIKKESVRLYEWRALSAARKIAATDSVLQSLYKIAFDQRPTLASRVGARLMLPELSENR